MMTRADWDKMTPQQQWDYVQLLDAVVDDAAENDGVIRGGDFQEDASGVLRRTGVPSRSVDILPHEPLERDDPSHLSILGAMSNGRPISYFDTFP